VKPKDSQVWSQAAVTAIADLVRPFDDINTSVFLKVILIAEIFCRSGLNYF
jgi:hypothetical protein